MLSDVLHAYQPSAIRKCLRQMRAFAAHVGLKYCQDVYDYGQVLGMSLMFYEAQRSGKLPANNRMCLERRANLNDRAPDGRDVTGGWYDAGDRRQVQSAHGLVCWSAGLVCSGVC